MMFIKIKKIFPVSLTFGISNKASDWMLKIILYQPYIFFGLHWYTMKIWYTKKDNSSTFLIFHLKLTQQQIYSLFLYFCHWFMQNLWKKLINLWHNCIWDIYWIYNNKKNVNLFMDCCLIDISFLLYLFLLLHLYFVCYKIKLSRYKPWTIWIQTYR